MTRWLLELYKDPMHWPLKSVDFHCALVPPQKPEQPSWCTPRGQHKNECCCVWSAYRTKIQKLTDPSNAQGHAFLNDITERGTNANWSLNDLCEGICAVFLFALELPDKPHWVPYRSLVNESLQTGHLHLILQPFVETLQSFLLQCLSVVSGGHCIVHRGVPLNLSGIRTGGHVEWPAFSFVSSDSMEAFRYAGDGGTFFQVIASSARDVSLLSSREQKAGDRLLLLPAGATFTVGDVMSECHRLLCRIPHNVVHLVEVDASNKSNNVPSVVAVCRRLQALKLTHHLYGRLTKGYAMARVSAEVDAPESSWCPLTEFMASFFCSSSVRVILGPTGMGKTATMLWLMTTLQDHDASFTPIYVNVGRVLDKDAKSLNLCDHVLKLLALPQDPSTKNYLCNSKIVFLLDSLDEATLNLRGLQQSTLYDVIGMSQWPQAKWVVASRRDVFCEKGLLLSNIHDDVTVGYLQPPQPSDLGALVEGITLCHQDIVSKSIAKVIKQSVLQNKECHKMPLAAAQTAMALVEDPLLWSLDAQAVERASLRYHYRHIGVKKVWNAEVASLVASPEELIDLAYGFGSLLALHTRSIESADASLVYATDWEVYSPRLSPKVVDVLFRMQPLRTESFHGGHWSFQGRVALHLLTVAEENKV